MKPKIHEQHMNSFDFTSLYPTVMKVYPIDKTKFRREKIERLIHRINDKRTNKGLPS